MRKALACLALVSLFAAAVALAGSTRPPTPVNEHRGKEAFYGHVTLEELSTTCDYDFPAILPLSQVTALNACPMPGVKLGDPCIIGALKASPDDGGSSFPGLGCPVAWASSDNRVSYKLVNCASGDGGPLDVPDAGWTIQCFAHAKQLN